MSPDNQKCLACRLARIGAAKRWQLGVYLERDQEAAQK